MVHCVFFLQVADREISRKSQIENMLEYMTRQLGWQDIIRELPLRDLISYEQNPKDIGQLQRNQSKRQFGPEIFFISLSSRSPTHYYSLLQ